MTAVSEFTFQTNDGTNIFAKKWVKEDVGKPKAIVQIAHGMAEHIGRYDSFAKVLVSENLFVYGNDHRGHGETGKKVNRIGYFADEQGFEKVVDDMRKVTNIVEKDYPDVPIFLFGHSMGSFLSRRYIQRFGVLLSGVILCGTSGDPGIMGKIGKMIAARESKKKGAKTLSPLLNNLTFGSYNKAFRPNRTQFDWLTRDEKEVDQYIADPLCGGIFTTGFFYDLLDGLLTTNMPQNIRGVPADLPIFLISGENDPVGGKKGKGVIQTMQQFKNAGVKDVSFKLYPDARHELLNEINKNEVQNDIIEWIIAHL